MKSHVTLLLLSCFIAIGTGTTISHGQEKVPKSFLSVLNVGQSVSLKDVGDKFEIMLMKDVKLGHKIVEVGADYIVVEDITGLTETRIHLTSIKTITRLRKPNE